LIRDGNVRLSTAVLVVALFGLALGPRWVARDTYVTADEDNWMRRAGGFAWGVANGRLGRTYQNGHPGVLTMELAILGQGPGGAERFADPATGNPRVVTAVPGFFEALIDARRAFALATAAIVTAMAMLTWRLFGPGPALIGGLLLALDPFYLAHSQLVHLDAMLSGCMGLAVLCGIVRWGHQGQLGWVVAGGVLSGLALLAKVPAVFLVVVVPLLAAWLGRWRGARPIATDLTLWSLAGLATVVALWPSMWVNPFGTVARMIEFARETGGQPHEQGSFFLGQVVVDPGPLFYPVAVFLRLSPAATLGLLALALVAWRVRASLSTERWRIVLAILAYTIGFGLVMTLGPKKFDRYLLPAFPMLDLLAGLGLWVVLSQNALTGREAKAEKESSSDLPASARSGLALHRVGLSLALLALLVWPLMSVFPHYLAYYNPLLGGGQTAVRAIPVGAGEGLNEVARWLNARPGAENMHVVSDSFDALKATFVGSGEPLRDRVPPSADYVVLYGYQTQIGHSPRVVVDYAARPPEYVVRLNGVEYARVYRGPRRATENGDPRAGTPGHVDGGV
jgi:hypothetical protein